MGDTPYSGGEEQTPFTLPLSAEEMAQLAKIDDAVFTTAQWLFLSLFTIADYYTVPQIDSIILSHTHDDRYYTEDEIISLLSNKSDTTHNHDLVYAALSHSHDSTYAALSHTHDDRYYTESEITTLLSGKSDSTHNHDSDYSAIGHDHDSRYYTEDEIDTIIQNSRDLLINGNMRWWQRGTSFTSVTNAAFSADRWKTIIANGSGTAPVFDIALDGINYYMKITVTASGVAGAGMQAGIYQKYEFYNSMKGKTVSARIRVNIPSGKTGLIFIADGVGATGINITGTGAFQEVTVSRAVSASATILQVVYHIANGTTINAASGDIHYIDRIQLTEGATALPFLPYDPIVDFERCLRYYWRGQTIGHGAPYHYGVTGYVLYSSGVSFPVVMASAPTISIITAPTYENCSHSSFVYDKYGFAQRVTVSASGTFRAYGGVYEADAEL